MSEKINDLAMLVPTEMAMHDLSQLMQLDQPFAAFELTGEFIKKMTPDSNTLLIALTPKMAKDLRDNLNKYLSQNLQ
ncbi:hypothetical protein [Providencia stuartii]|uniref:hypothetical protein n=1 Tax=Providencia stuartii TaxID=588 RepID=UPI0011228707|nr:hypothetical protein [Providencia stuartii]